MSDETYDALEAALREHVAAADAHGALLTDWIITAACVGGFEGTGYLHLVSKATSPHARLGLALVTHRNAESTWDNDPDDDEDDE